MIRRRSDRRLSPAEETLWQQVVKDVKPFDKSGSPQPSIPAKKIIPEAKFSPSMPGGDRKVRREQILERTPLPVPQVARPKTALGDSSAQLHGGWARKIRRGHMDIDARVDLHGLNRDQAFTILHRFLIRAMAENNRRLLVITGKGRGTSDTQDGYSGGVLRTEVPRWLRHGPLADRILSVQSAHPKDGGGGACYVILRREREYR